MLNILKRHFELEHKLFAFPRYAVIFLHTLSLLTTFGYGLYHVYSDSLAIGVLSLTASLCTSISLISVLLHNSNKFTVLIFLLSIAAPILLTAFNYGYRGLIFVFPFTACLFYLLPFRTAIALSLIFSSTALLLALNVMEVFSVVRYGITFIISIALSAGYAHLIEQQKQQLEKDAHYDALTGITNRRHFNHWLNSVMEEKSSSKIALFYIDIDDFKHVNDSFGHNIGDQLLVDFSERIINVIRQNELIMATNKIYNFARLAGDEFVIAIMDLDDISGAKKIAQRLIEQTSLPFHFDSVTVKIHISVGIAYSEDETSAEMLLHNADSSMYRAKENGKNNYYFFDHSISDEMERRKDIEQHINHTLDNELFELAYMPIYTIDDTPKIAGVEALIRSNEEYLKNTGPEKYIPIAEASGQIKEIDLWVMERVFKDIHSLSQDMDVESLCHWYAVNISSTELLDASFVDKIQTLLTTYSIDPKMIHLEITETKLVPYETVIIERMKRLRDLDFHLALDDYGTGYTGFAQLLNFPGDYIKIDRSFVKEIDKGESNHTKMIGVMLSIAKIYGLKVIAEGVETKTQMDYLKNLGCHYAQGYYFSKPISFDDFITLRDQNIG